MMLKMEEINSILLKFKYNHHSLGLLVNSTLINSVV